MDPSLDEKIKELGGLLGIDNIPSGISDVIGSLLGGEKVAPTQEVVAASEPAADDTSIDPKLITDVFVKLRQLQANSDNDDKIRLLKALRPFLSEKRRQRVDRCVNVIMLRELAPLLVK